MMYLLYDQMFDATSRGERMGKQERERERVCIIVQHNLTVPEHSFVRSFIH